MIIDQRFELLDLAGRGGMGEVYRARDLTSGAQVALKLIRPDGGSSAGVRFERESLALAALSHPSIVAYVAHGATPDGQAYLAMEWLAGKTLSERLGEGPLAARDALQIAGQIAEAVAAAHRRGLVHRDLKPGNVLLCEGRSDRVKVLDFGLVRGADVGVTITHVNVVGTPAYMSPEQARGDRVDARTDVYSLGCILFECLAGRRPFEAEAVAALLVRIVLDPVPRLDRFRAGLPPDLVNLVARMMAKTPTDRPASGGAVATELQTIQVSEDAPAAGPGVVEKVLTATERRFQCVILARRAAAGELSSETVTALHVLRPPSSLGETQGEGQPGQHPYEPQLEALRRTADRHGAHVERLLDGTLLIAFNAGGAATDLAVRGARCALALRDVMPALGLVVAAGWGLPQSGGLSGELPEQAVALLEGGGAQAIRVNALMRELLDERFEVAPGAEGGLLLAERSQHDGGRSLLGRVSPFVGRTRELTALTSLLDLCREESVARAALVTGEAGMGKSRLRHEFTRLARERGEVEVWTAAGDPQRQGSAYAMLAQAIRQAAGVVESEPLPSQRSKLSARVARALRGEDPTTAALLGEVISAPFSEDEAPALRALRHDPGAMGDQIRAACGRWLAAEVAARPLVLILEDLHWGDLPTVRLLDEVLGQQRERPLLVLGLARPEVHEQFPQLWARREVQEIRLAALTRKASEALIRQMLGEVSDEVAGLLAERAQGNAFFIEELIRAVARGQAEAFPETVVAMLQRRLEAQPSMARYVLRAASVFGRDFWDEGVFALVGGSRRANEVREHLALLVEGELLLRVEPSTFPETHQYRFRHDLLRDAASAMLAPEDRALGHRLAADWLEEAGERDPLLLARHRERGGEHDKAAAHYARAARSATQAGDAASALRYVESARQGELPPPLAIELHIAAAAAAGRTNRLDVAEREALAALGQLPRSSAAWHHVAILLIVVWTWKGSVAPQTELVEQMLQETGGERIDLEHLYAWAGVSGNMFRMGRPREALEFVRRVEERAPELGMEEPYSHLARFYRAYFLSHEPEVALLEAQAATAILQRIGDLNTRDSTLLNAADAAVGIGAYREAEDLLRTWLAGSDTETHFTPLGQLYLARALLRQGRLEEAAPLFARTPERFAAMRIRLREGQARCGLAELLIAQGDLAAAGREVNAALDLLAYSPTSHAEALALAASLRLRLGDAAEALALARDSHAKMEAVGVVSHAEAEVRLVYAEALQAAGEREAALAALKTAHDRLLERAATITQEAYRTSFLQVPANARTLELAQEWGAGG